MPEYKFGDAFFTEDEVKQRATEKGLTIDEYLTQNPEVEKVEEGKQNGTAQTGTTTVPDMVSKSEDGSSEPPVAPVNNRTDWIKPNFFDLQEEEAVSQLQVRYPEFEFKQSGRFFPFDKANKSDHRKEQRLGLANYVEVTAPNGEKLLLETAISQTLPKVIASKGEGYDVKGYYQDQLQDLTNFIEVNATAKKDKLTEAKSRRRSLYLGFAEATGVTPEELEGINDEFPDISIFDTQTSKDFTGYIPVRDRVPGLPEYKDVITQPYEDILEQAAVELKTEGNITQGDENSIKERALQILRNNAEKAKREEKGKQYLETLEGGEVPKVLQEDFLRFVKEGEKLNMNNLKPYITVGAKEYREDLSLAMLNTVDARVKVENSQTELQNIINKKVYTEEDKVRYDELFKGYEANYDNYNNSVEELNGFTMSVDDQRAQLNMLQKNYNDWDKQGASLLLNFRDFAAKAAYGTSALVGADGDLPDEKDPTRTREEVRTQELVDVLNQSQIIRSGYGDDVSFDKAFDSVSNFTKWTVSMGNSQLPILASLATPGGWSALLTSSFGENYKEMTYEQMKIKASSELLGFNYKDPRNFEENSRFNKWAFSMMFAAPEVLLDRATTGMRVRGIKEMFKSGKDELIDKNLKEVMSELAFGLPQDATLGAMSEGTTQLWQNFLTGKEDIWEGVDEAAFSGLLMDGVLSSVPTLKAAVFTQMSDPQKIKDIQADRKKLDDLYAIRENALKFQPKIGGNLDSQIKELEQKIETKIKENVDSIIGVGSRGLTATAVDAYVKATGYKARLKNQAQSILNDNLTSDSRKQELLKDLYLQYEAVKNYQNELISEKGSEFALWSQNSKNKASLDVFVREAKAKLAKDGKTDPTDLEIQEVTRVLYNTEKILQEETAVKKAKLDKDVDLNETITYAKTEEEFDNWVDEVIQPKIDALKSKETLTNKDVKEISNLEESKKAYKEGSYGFNVDGKSIAIVENMAKDDRLEIRTHELGHELGARAFKNNPAIFNGMAKTILDWAKVNDVGLFNRLERITERKNDQLIADEVMAVFFEEVAANRVNLKSEKNRGLLSIFGFGTNKAMKDNYGIDFELAGVDDTFELVYGIAKKISKGTITKADIDKLSGSKAVEALKIKGEQIVNQYLFQTENIVKKASKVQEKIDALPDMYNLEDWQKEGADDAIVQSYQDLQGMIANKAFMLDKLPNFSKEDFIDETLMRLMEHMRRFNPWKKEFRNGNPNPIFKALVDQGVKESDIPKLTWAEVKNKLGSEVVGKYGFSGWINSQLMNKIGDVLKSKTATTETFSVDETADTFKEIVETRDDYEILEEEDLSLQAQLRKQQREKKLAEQGMEADVEYSKFRRELMFGDNKGIDAKMKQIIEGITLNILASPKYINLDLSKIETELQRDYEVAIKKVVQDAIGGGQNYVDFLIKNKRTILRHIDISSLVAIERQVKPEDKIMTKFVRRLQTKKDVQDAIDNGWLSHIDNPAQGPSLYKVLDPSVSDFVKFYDLPRYVESAKKVKQWDSLGLETQQEIAKQTGKTLEAVRKEYVQTRSGLKGTRKDTLAERISNQLAFDATMQVLQSPEFAQKRAEAGKPVVAQAKIKEIARRIDRGLDVKFAKKSVPQFAASMASDLITDASKRNSLKIDNKLINASKYRLYDADLKQLAVDIAEHILKDSRNATILSAINKITDRPTIKDIIKEESLEAEQAKLSETQDVNDAINGLNTDAYLSIRYSKKRRDEYIRQLKNKRPEVSARAEALVDEVFEFVDSDLIPKNKKVKFEKLAFHYMVNGYVILPEDGYKIIQAEMLASRNKIDPFSVGNPNELIEEYAKTVKVKDEKTNPDKVKELSNKKIVEGAVSGVTVYDVEATKAGQKAIRKICDTHWGKESNPWCVIARVVPQSIAQEMAEEFGEIIEQQEEQFDDLASSFTHWKAYNNGGNGFKVSFINGKLNSFRDGNSKEWWNRMDKPSKNLVATDNKRIDGVLNVFDVDVKTGDKVLVQKQFGENASNGLITNYTYEKIPSRSGGKPGKLTLKESMTMNRGKIDSGITKEFDYNNAPDVEKAIKIPTPEALGAKPTFDFDSIILKDLKKFEIYTDYTFTQEQNEITTEAQKIKADETGIKQRETVVGKITRADENILKEYKGKEVTIVKTRTYNKGLTLGTQTKITINGKDIRFAKKVNQIKSNFDYKKVKYSKKPSRAKQEAALFKTLDALGANYHVTKDNILYFEMMSSPMYEAIWFKNEKELRILPYDKNMRSNRDFLFLATNKDIKDSIENWETLKDSKKEKKDLLSVGTPNYDKIQNIESIPNFLKNKSNRAVAVFKLDLFETFNESDAVIKDPASIEPEDVITWYLSEGVDLKDIPRKVYEDVVFNTLDDNLPTVSGEVYGRNIHPGMDGITASQYGSMLDVLNDANIKFAKKTDVELAIEKALSGVNLEGQSQLSLELNKMIERSVGISAEETISRAISRDVGANKNKRQLYIPPSAEDFLGLMYFIVGKGKQGDADLKFIKENLTDKFSEAYTKLDTIRRSVLQDVSTLNKNFPEVQAKLKDKMPGSMFTYDQAIRVYLYNKNGYTVPGISIEETANLVARVTTDKELAVYAESFNLLSRTDKWVKPSEYWTASTITSDMNKIVEGVHRASVLSDWVDNKNEIFSKDNLSKLEAAYGTNYIDALEDMLYRMETGLNRGRSYKDKTTTRFTNFLNNSVATIMFFNTKSALLQTLSTVNYINFEDNNIFAASKAFADQKQFWSDFVMIYNSDFLKGRRSGLKTDIQLSEVADVVAKASNKAQATMAYLLKIGFSPTQAADSFAIAMGGSTFYRNRVNKYLKEGKSQSQAESQAFIDFREVTEETQQSARPDRVSQQQTSSAGRFILAFQNAPMQFQRIIKKSMLDLAKGRGDYKANISRIIYYGAVQNLIFSAMQNALFALAFDDEDEHKLLDKDLAKKKENDDKRIARIGNSMVDTILRGSGISGAVISTVKNVIMKFYEEKEKGARIDKAKILIQAASLSPQVGSKLSKLNKALNTYMYEKDAIPLMSKLDTKNPIYSIGAPVVEAALNIPLDRLLTKTNNLKEALDSSNASWQRVGTALGWSAWSLGIDTRDEVKDVIKEGKEKGLIKGKGKAKPCLGVKSDGMPCGNTTTSGNFCYLHD